MRALSERSADRCETAEHSRCKCRCKGALHGAKRGNVRELPLDDPHSPAKKCKRCGGTGQVRLQRWTYPKLDHDPMAQCHDCGGAGKVLR